MHFRPRLIISFSKSKPVSTLYTRFPNHTIRCFFPGIIFFHSQINNKNVYLSLYIKLMAGVDVAKGPENWAYYIVFGSNWVK